jgi:DNA/RNA-binding domain of Phe-tRNA-synthetase-like protein
MFQFIVTRRWREIHPNASAGILIMQGVSNPDFHPALEERKQFLEDELRSIYEGMDRAKLAALPVIQAYNAYYKPYKKTYHVQLQLESLVSKGRSIPRVFALVEAMFMAELSNLLLTAGHDLSAIKSPVHLEAADGDEVYTTLQGAEKTLKPGDMYMYDDKGVISSVLYGPDARTQITPHTTEVLFAVYAPEGIHKATLVKHLENIRENVLLFSPAAQIDRLDIY